jgi:hypothetical protein
MVKNKAENPETGKNVFQESLLLELTNKLQKKFFAALRCLKVSGKQLSLP